MSKYHILVVDDDPLAVLLISIFLTNGYSYYKLVAPALNSRVSLWCDFRYARVLVSLKKQVRTLIVVVLVALMLFGVDAVNAANYYSVASGNWSTLTTWSTVSGGTDTPLALPTFGDAVYIEGGYTVTVDITDARCESLTLGSTSGSTAQLTFAESGNPVLTARTVQIGGGESSANGAITMTNGSTLRIDEKITKGIGEATWVPGSGTVEFMGSDNVLPSFLNSFGNVIIPVGTTTLGTGTIINGDLTIGPGGYFETASNYTLNVIGRTSLRGVFILAGTGKKTFTGDANLNEGTWNETGIAEIDFGGSLINDAFKFTANTGTHTFKGTGTLDGSTATVIPTVNFTGIYTNNKTLTCETALTVTSPGLLTNRGTTTASKSLSGTGGIIQGTNGILNIGGTSAIATLDAVTNVGNTVNYTGTGLTVYDTPYSNLTISGLGMVANSDLTVNGYLDLAVANVSSTKGCLDMGTFTLTLNGPYNAVTGTGDVTGIVKRTAFMEGKDYTFSNQYTTLNLTGETMPSSISINTVLTGGKLDWMSANGVARYYDIVKVGGTANASMKLHYLDSEIYGSVTETTLAYYMYVNPTLMDRGKSSVDVTNNFVALAPLNLDNIASTSFGTKYWTLAASSNTADEWLGVATGSETDWNLNDNWSAGVPGPSTKVFIPANKTNYPTLPSSATIGTLRIEGILNGGNPTIGNALTITGATAAWINTGTFNPGNSTIVFANSGGSNSATMAGTTDFYNVTVSDGSQLLLQENNIMRIAGSLTLSTGGILNANSSNNTVEYNNDVQTIVNPNGTRSGYHNLIISGSGAKTMPASVMNVDGDFIMRGSCSTTAGAALRIGGNVILTSGTFNDGGFTHEVAGNWTNNGGTFVSTGTIEFDGAADQSIDGSQTGQMFNNFRINKMSGMLSVGGSTTHLTVNTLILTRGNFTAPETLNLSSAILTAGHFTAGSNTNISGNWTNNGVAFTPGTGVVTLNGSTTQTIDGASPTTFGNLTVSNTGEKVFNTAPGISGILSMISAATVSGNSPNYTGSASLVYSAGTRDASMEWASPFNGTNGVRINSGVITLNGAKELGAGVPLIIDIGATLNTSAVNNYPLNLGGDFVNNGTFTANASPIGITGIMPVQNITGFATNGPVLMTKAAGTATLTGNVKGVRLTVDGPGGTLDLGNGLSHQINGNVIISNGTLMAGTNTHIFVSGNWTRNGGTFDAQTSAIFLNGAEQTIDGSEATTFYGLGIAGSGMKKLATVPTINNILGIEGDENSVVSVAPNYGKSATLEYFVDHNVGVEWITPFTASGGVIISRDVEGQVIRMDGPKEFAAFVPLTIKAGATLNTNGFQLTLAGNFVNLGTLIANASPVVITGTMPSQSIAGFTTSGPVSMTKTAGTATFTGNVNGAGLTIDGAGGTLNLGNGLSHSFTGDITLTNGILNGGSSTLHASSSSATTWTGTGSIFLPGTSAVLFDGADQSISTPTTFNNLVFSGSGIKNIGSYTAVNQNLTVDGVSLNIAPTVGLTVSGGIDNSGVFTLQSSMAGTATLLCDSPVKGTGTSKMQQFFSYGSPGPPKFYRFWYYASPVDGAKSNVFNTNGNLTDFQVWSFDETKSGTANPYKLVENGSPISFETGTGYVSRMASDRTVTFSGVFNTGDVTIPLTRTGTTGGYNLIGNPYPSYLDWDNAIRTGGVETNIWYRTMYFGGKEMIFDTYNATGDAWTDNSGNGIITRYIPPMQAFWVKTADESGSSVTFTNELRSHQDIAGRKLRCVKNDSIQTLRLQVLGNSFRDEALIRFYPDALDSLDAYDSPKMSNENASIPELFTYAGTQQVAINGLKPFDSSKEIKLGFRTGTSGTFTIKAKEFLNIGEGTTVILKDKQANAEQDLTIVPEYTFNSDVTNSADRFSIVISKTTTDDPSLIPEQKFEVLTDKEGTVNVYLRGIKGDGATITICDIQGRQIVRTQATGEMTSINTHLSSGIYMLAVRGKEFKGVKKIAIFK